MEIWGFLLLQGWLFPLLFLRQEKTPNQPNSNPCPPSQPSREEGTAEGGSVPFTEPENPSETSPNLLQGAQTRPGGAQSTLRGAEGAERAQRGHGPGAVATRSRVAMPGWQCQGGSASPAAPGCFSAARGRGGETIKGAEIANTAPSPWQPEHRC